MELKGYYGFIDKFDVLFQTKVDRVQGADPTGLENKIKLLYGSEEGDTGDSSVAGHVGHILIQLIIIILISVTIIYITNGLLYD